MFSNEIIYLMKFLNQLNFVNSETVYIINILRSRLILQTVYNETNKKISCNYFKQYGLSLKADIKLNKRIVLCVIICMISVLFYDENETKAVETNIVKAEPDRNVTVIFSSEDDELNENQRVLDMALGHFSENITFVSTKELDGIDLDATTHLFYYGENEENVPDDLSNVISSFDGPKVAIGYNIEQLGNDFSFVEVDEKETIEEIEYMNEGEKTRRIAPKTVLDTVLENDAEVLVTGNGDQGEFPLIMRQDDNYYVATDNLLEPYSVYFSQTLNDIFNIESTEETPAYLRLEDVHPLADPETLMTIAEELKKRKIPYMIAVIPVYTNPETGKEYHFEDRPETLKALKYMQDNGGTVVLHGYTHQFRQSETGEGFEFWDVKNQTPIYHGPDENVEKLLEEDFKNRDAYETYMEENLAFERRYIEERLTKGVQELANYGLYPLAFEAPHYTMSQHGYKIVSESFSTYVGQVQLSDEEWEIMNTTPYASKPDFLNGMLLLPETIGFVQPEEEHPVNDMMNKANLYQVTDGGMIGSFYHPYLGTEAFIELIEEMEKIPNIEWVDLKKVDANVNVEHVNIKTHDGEIDVDINQMGLMNTSIDFPGYHFRNFLNNITWSIAIIGAVSVFLLIGFTFFQKIRGMRSDRRGNNG